MRIASIERTISETSMIKIGEPSPNKAVALISETLPNRGSRGLTTKSRSPKNLSTTKP